MPGFYNEDLQVFEDVVWMRTGDWYEDEHRLLYIITNLEHGLSENEGPDGDVMDVINAFCREGMSGPDIEDELTPLGLLLVREHRKGFSPERGYYVLPKDERDEVVVRPKVKAVPEGLEGLEHLFTDED